MIFGGVYNLHPKPRGHQSPVGEHDGLSFSLP